MAPSNSCLYPDPGLKAEKKSIWITLGSKLHDKGPFPHIFNLDVSCLYELKKNFPQMLNAIKQQFMRNLKVNTRDSIP
jgi:hypothetical protein